MPPSPAPPLIRPADPGDAPEIATLLADLGYPGNEAGPVRDRLAAWTRAGGATVLVAVTEDRLAGVLALATIPYFEHDGYWGRVVALVVAPEVRGRGTGRLLMAAAEAAALAQGCLTMEITSARQRAEAQAFYRSLGYQDWCPQSTRLLKDLVPGASDANYAMRAERNDRR